MYIHLKIYFLKEMHFNFPIFNHFFLVMGICPGGICLSGICQSTRRHSRMAPDGAPCPCRSGLTFLT